MFKTELHSHTFESSGCSRIYTKRLVDNIKQLGYKSIVITDHFDKYSLERFKKSGDSSKSYVDFFLKGYKRAKAYGESEDINVLLGLEIELAERRYLHYLIYGATEEFLREYPELYQMKQQDLYKLCKNSNLLMYEAHPVHDLYYRKRLCPQGDMDGFELYNTAHTNSMRNTCGEIPDARYQLMYERFIENSLEYAKENNLSVISGGDRHRLSKDGSSGILTKEEIKTNNDLVKALKSNHYQILRR